MSLHHNFNMLLKLNANVCNPHQASCSVMAHRPQRSLTVEFSLCEPDHMVALVILKIYRVKQCHVKVMKITITFLDWSIFKQRLFGYLFGFLNLLLYNLLKGRDIFLKMLSFCLFASFLAAGYCCPCCLTLFWMAVRSTQPGSGSLHSLTFLFCL